MSESPNAATGVRVGDVLAGKYRIEKILGAGGMGVVVAAQHLYLDEKVAIKFLLPHALTNAEAVARFALEARAAVRIKSEHVARVIDVGKLETGAPYLVMEFLEGSDLSAWLRQRGALPIDLGVEFVIQACDAIADAHSIGIVHRDLKPSNLFCIRKNDGSLCVKVLDFGISKITGRGADMGMTRTTATMGSPLYMSPEQARSARSVDARTDIWSLGVILYEFTAGRVPFCGDAIAEIVLKIASAPPPPLREVRPDAPLGLERIILRCLEKDRSRRYQNVSELAAELAEYAPPRARALVERIARVMQGVRISASELSPQRSSSVPALSASAAGGSSGAVSAATMAPLGQTKPPGMKKGTRKVIAGVAGGALVLTVLAGVFLVKMQGGESTNNEAAPTAPTVAPGVAPVASSEMAAPSSPQVLGVEAASLSTLDRAEPDTDAAKTADVAGVAGTVPPSVAASARAAASLQPVVTGALAKPKIGASPAASARPTQAAGRGRPENDDIGVLIDRRK